MSDARFPKTRAFVILLPRPVTFSRAPAPRPPLSSGGRGKGEGRARAEDHPMEHETAPSAAPTPLTPSEVEELHAVDRKAGATIVVLLVSIFTIGVILYSIV